MKKINWHILFGWITMISFGVGFYYFLYLIIEFLITKE